MSPGRPAPGRLWLIPTPLGEPSDARRVLPAATLEAIEPLDYFIAESAKTARAFLKAAGTRLPLQQLEIRELNEHTRAADVTPLLAPVLAGRDAGLLSEAGCPAVADPGAELVAAAHAAGIEVRPLVGPSSLLLALMASGLDGQRFAFAGYVPAQPAERAKRLRELERKSAQHRETVLVIETPYRNQALFDSMLEALRPDTRVLVATDLTTGGERIRTMDVAAWRARREALARSPTVFGLLAGR